MQTLPSGVTLAPFRGIRYSRDRVSGIANVTSPPYDVISATILERLRAADPHNIVGLILPGEGADASQTAARRLHEWLSSGVLIRDRCPALYIYEQCGEGWLQRGIIGLVRLGTPEAAGILPHENVMPLAVAGRRELMMSTEANLEPIFLIYDGDPTDGAADPDGAARPDTVPLTAGGLTATGVINQVATERNPLLCILTEDRIRHRLWRLADPEEQAVIIDDMAGRRALIADGHHRYAAYLDVQAQMRAANAGPGPVGLRPGVPGRLGRLPVQAGIDPPGSAGA